MPTYEYKCLECGHRFEVFQSMTAEPLSECEECKGKVKRLIGTGAGIIFKGSGFYCTDYRSDSYKQSANKDKTSPKPNSSSSPSSGTQDKASPSSGTQDKASPSSTSTTSSPKKGD